MTQRFDRLPRCVVGGVELVEQGSIRAMAYLLPHPPGLGATLGLNGTKASLYYKSLIYTLARPLTQPYVYH